MPIRVINKSYFRRPLLHQGTLTATYTWTSWCATNGHVRRPTRLQIVRFIYIIYDFCNFPNFWPKIKFYL